MNRIIEIIAACLGGFSLLAVSFLGFAVMSGAPLHEMAVVGKMFRVPEKSDADVILEREEAAKPKTARELVSSNLGALSSFELPSPFSVVELEGLETRLKTRLAEVHELQEGLAARDEALALREAQLADQMEKLLEIRRSLDDYRKELDERSNEVERDERTQDAALEEEAKIKAAIFSGMTPESAAKGLVEDYRDEAAQILARMDDQNKARKLLGEIFQTDQAAWREISDAYARLSASAAR